VYFGPDGESRVSGLAVHTGPSGITCETVRDRFRCLSAARLSPPLVDNQRRAMGGGHRDRRGRHEIVVRWRLTVGSAVHPADGIALVTNSLGTLS
jgi:hypothetical protein